jgi:DNA-binding NarL/FixJ family response regulator
VIRVAIADDQALVLEGFAAILAAESDMKVVGLAADGKAAVELARASNPDVFVMDIRMPELDGIAATERITRGPQSPRVLVLTTFDADRLVFDAMRAGASGFLLKDAPSGRLARAVRDIASGETLVDPTITRRLVERFAHRPPPGPDRPETLADLSEREIDVLRGLGRGLSNSELAAELYLSPATVKTHVASVLRKLGLRDRAQAVVAVYESGLIEPGG